MTVREFRDRLSRTRFVVTITREPDGALFLEVDHGYRDLARAWLRPPCADDDDLDEDLARLLCRDLRIPSVDVGL